MNVTANAEHFRVLLVDDDDGARRGLSTLLEAYGYVIEEFSSAKELLSRLPIDDVACLILDIEMPEMSGLELQEALVERGYSYPIVFLTAHADVSRSVVAIKRGAEDFLPKLVDEEQLLNAVQRSVNCALEKDADMRESRRIAECAATLTERERQVCERLIAGMLNKQIAPSLGISERTVKAHKARVMEKFGVHSIAQLVRLADQAGLEPWTGANV